MIAAQFLESMCRRSFWPAHWHMISQVFAARFGAGLAMIKTRKKKATKGGLVFLIFFSEEQDPAPKNWTGGIDGIGSFCFWRVGMGMFLEWEFNVRPIDGRDSHFLDFRIAFGQFYPPRAKWVLQILIRKIIQILPFCIKNLAANPMPQPATIWGW